MIIASDNDVTHYVTTKGKYPEVSNNTIKNLGADVKGQSPCFYIVPSETLVIVLLRSTC